MPVRYRYGSSATLREAIDHPASACATAVQRDGQGINGVRAQIGQALTRRRTWSEPDQEAIYALASTTPGNSHGLKCLQVRSENAPARRWLAPCRHSSAPLVERHTLSGTRDLTQGGTAMTRRHGGTTTRTHPSTGLSSTEPYVWQLRTEPVRSRFRGIAPQLAAIGQTWGRWRRKHQRARGALMSTTTAMRIQQERTTLRLDWRITTPSYRR